MEQVLCARGYSDQIAGFASASYMGFIVLASVPVGILVTKMKMHLQISKIFLTVGTLGSGAFAYFITLPDHTALLITLCVFMGISAR